MSKIIKLPFKTYSAKSFKARLSELNFTISGTLDGFIDLSIKDVKGENSTYSITCNDARVLVASLLSSVDDIQNNCIFDNDTLLIK
jgi:hypothetical protein